jgi:creatinine amidohydrolase
MPTERPWVLDDTTWPVVRDTVYTVAVLPWGATEAHNYHLPYGTDTVETTHVAHESARLAWDAGARVVVLPPVPFGVNTGQLDIPLCLNMNPSTQLAVLRDLIACVELAGISKLVVLNGHGGNDFRQMIRELQPTTDLFLCTMNWYTCVDAKAHFTDLGDHAGELETSMMQRLAPELVRPLAEASDGHAKRFRVRALREGWAWAPRHWTEVTADTGVGDPRAANADKGGRFFAAVTERIAEFLVELAAADLAAMYGD